MPIKVASPASGEVKVGRVAINYAYARDYPDKAVEWITAAMAAADTAPESFRPVLDNPLSGTITDEMPIISATPPCCEDIFRWAATLPGHEHSVSNNEWYSAICFVDDPDELAKNEAIRNELPPGHPWVKCVTVWRQS